MSRIVTVALIALAYTAPVAAQGTTGGTVRTLGTSNTPGVTTANPVTGTLSNNTNTLSAGPPSAAASGSTLRPGAGLKPNSAQGLSNGAKPAPMQANGVRKVE